MDKNEILTFFNNVVVEYGNFDRLFKLFQTDTKKYMYDVGTGKVCECSEIEYNFLKELVSNGNIETAIDTNINKYNVIFDSEIMNLKETIKQQQLLRAAKLTEFERQEDVIMNKIEGELQQITLELTESCNLACRYCIYGEENIDFRKFSNKVMNWEVARAAIDYALSHSDKKLAVTFYGGEPLLHYNLLKQSVEYVLKNKEEKECIFSMTTNLTLITNEMACYLAQVPEFSVVCSLDGNERMHNKNRVFKNGSGSYDRAIKGLKNLVEAYGDRAENNISLSMVMDTPVNDETMGITQEFFEQLSWLPEKIVKRISYIRPSSDKEMAALSQNSDEVYTEPIGDWSLNRQLDESADRAFTDDFLERMLLSIHNRILTKEPVQKYQLNGCCYPGSRRLYVSANGDFYICERIGKAPILGNVFEGVNKTVVLEEYHERYVKNSIPHCAECWAVNLCEMCFMECYDEAGFNKDKKNMACVRMKHTIERNLKAYFSLLEEKPEIIEKLNRISVS